MPLDSLGHVARDACRRVVGVAVREQEADRSRVTLRPASDMPRSSGCSSHLKWRAVPGQVDDALAVHWSGVADEAVAEDADAEDVARAQEGAVPSDDFGAAASREGARVRPGGRGGRCCRRPSWPPGSWPTRRSRRRRPAEACPCGAAQAGLEGACRSGAERPAGRRPRRPGRRRPPRPRALRRPPRRGRPCRPAYAGCRAGGPRAARRRAWRGRPALCEASVPTDVLTNVLDRLWLTRRGGPPRWNRPNLLVPLRLVPALKNSLTLFRARLRSLERGRPLARPNKR